MVLSRPDILTYLKEGKLKFTPEIRLEQVAQVSIDLHLGRKFTEFKEPPGYIPSIKVDPSVFKSLDLWEHHEQDEYLLKPGNFVLAQTLERVHMPNDLVGLVEGRSSWARLGVTIHLTAPKIDPGFDATITLEMTNLGRVPVLLCGGIDKPAQLMLFRISEALPASELYGAGPEDMFQGQDTPIPHRK